MFILVVNLVNLGQDASQFIFKKYDWGDNYSTTLFGFYDFNKNDINVATTKKYFAL